jgi:hypothetical protein
VARKSWDDLSPAYRARLVRKGISEEQHRAGAQLSAARGHTSTSKENERRRAVRRIRKHSEVYAEEYGLDEDEVREQLMRLPTQQALDIITLQEASYELFMEGQIQAAGAVWFMSPREHDVPDWIYYYHGPFRF